MFWGDGYKSLAHVVFISYGWYKNLVGLRFMMLLLYGHFVMAVILNSRKRKRSESEERRAALYAYRAATAYIAQLVDDYPAQFFVVPQTSPKGKKPLYTWVTITTIILMMMWFPAETRVVLNKMVAVACSAIGIDAIEPVPSISVYDVLDLFIAPIAVLAIVVGGIGRIGPKDPRYATVTPTTALPVPNGGFFPFADQREDSTPNNSNIIAAAENRAAPSDAVSGTSTILAKVVDDNTQTTASLAAQIALNDPTNFLTPTRMDQLLSEGFSYNNSQTRAEALMPLLRTLSQDLTATPYWMFQTPDGEWDSFVPRFASLPYHAHKILALITTGPQWTQWKRFYNKPERKPLPGHGDGRNPIADAENAEDDIITMNHPTAFCQVKCGYNRTRLRGVKFEDVVSWFSDDLLKENGEPIKNTKDLNVFRYDGFLSEYRRLAIHTYSAEALNGPVNTTVKVVHYIYKQMVIGVAARDCPMFQTARELTEDEIRHYKLFNTHANTFYPNRVQKGSSRKAEEQPIGRVFLLSSSPAANVPPVPGSVRATIHRHAILVIAPPKKTECGDADDDDREIVDIVTMMCGEPGGKIPSFAVDFTRGEQLKVINAMCSNIMADMKAAGLINNGSK
eukprot:GILI01023805.1.p1 GENE.GILI01023805.1~~GILI01023805.1.p1  ORF type:complete len:682 (-),score=101.65 GILI01023805.1:156-2021(-)